jgi:hypothetical protein
MILALAIAIDQTSLIQLDDSSSKISGAWMTLSGEPPGVCDAAYRPLHVLNIVGGTCELE